MKTAHVIVSVLGFAIVGCTMASIEGENGEPSTGAAKKPTSQEACVGPNPLGDLEPESLAKCACAKGGAARCVAKAKLPNDLASQLDACDGTGGACVPDSFLGKNASAPATCESPFGEGRCVSLCIPAVAEQAALLDRGKGDVCKPDERCAPCKNPLENGASTGVCEIGVTKSSADCPDGGAPAPSPSSPTSPVTCPYSGPPIDVSKLEVCADGMRCVPAASIPPAIAPMLAKCKDPSQLCAPEKQIAAAGQYRPKECTSVANAEGRCMNVNLPPVAAQKDLLPAEGCDANERCVPCFDPTSGTATGVCSTVSCDAPKKPAVTFKTCCETKGKCVPSAMVPAAAREELGSDDGTCDKGNLCVPSEMLAVNAQPAPCSASIPFVGSYAGVCVSDCLESLVPQGSCKGSQVCLPCKDPFDGTPTGAPGCK